MNTIINFRIDAKTKKAAQKNAEKLGMPLSSVLSGYMHEFARTGEFKVALVPNAKTRKRLDQAHKDIENKRWDKFSPILRTQKEIEEYFSTL